MGCLPGNMIRESWCTARGQSLGLFGGELVFLPVVCRLLIGFGLGWGRVG